MEKIDLNIKNILTNWNVSDALRELIANAFDESVLSNTKEPIISFDNGKLVIRDFGSGINEEHFIQNENESKKANNVIGRFGIGLKDSISVLYRNNKKVIFKSRNGIFYPDLSYKSGLNSKIETIHIIYKRENIDFLGTEIIIEDIENDEFESAKNNFVKLSNSSPIFSCSKGEIYENSDYSSIYYNGMKVSEDNNLLFSYNILQPNAKLNKSLNRERKMISRDAYRDNIISILKESINAKYERITNKIISNFNIDNNEWGFLEIKKAILDNTSSILVGNKNLNQNSFESYANKENYNVIWISDKDYKSLYNDEKFTKKTLDYFGYEYINDFDCIDIDPKELDEHQYNNYVWLNEQIKILSENWTELRWIYKDIKMTIIESHPNASGLSNIETNQIKLVKNIFNNKKLLLNTTIHEICHLTSKQKDVTLEFEKVLTSSFYYLYLLGKENKDEV